MAQEGQQQPASAWGFASGIGKRLWDVGCGGTFSGSQLGKAVADLRLQRPQAFLCDKWDKRGTVLEGRGAGA